MCTNLFRKFICSNKFVQKIIIFAEIIVLKTLFFMNKQGIFFVCSMMKNCLSNLTIRKNALSVL